MIVEPTRDQDAPVRWRLALVCLVSALVLLVLSIAAGPLWAVGASAWGTGFACCMVYVEWCER